MRRFFTTSAIALVISASPVALLAQTMPQSPDATSPTGTQDTMNAPPASSADPAPANPAPTPQAGAPYTPGPAEMSQMDTWPADKKTKYQAWPADYQQYFWTLDADQQKGWWALTDEQKAQVFAMSPEDRAKVWPTIVGQVNGAPAPQSATPAAPPAESLGASASAGSAANKTYPVCSKTVTDGCRNRGGQ